MLVLGLISETFVSIGIWILSGIYTVVSSAFRLFLVLAEGKLVDSSSYSTIMNNIYVIIGVVMLFVLAFALLRGMVNPDDKKQGTSTIRKVIINLITSTLLVVLLPTIFSFAYDFQDSILHYNVIGKLFGYGVTDVESNVSSVSVGANRIANGVFTAFFYPNCSDADDIIECQNDLTGDSGRTYNEIVAEVDQTGKFSYYREFSEAADEGEIDFNFLLSLIGGLVLVYVAISFCFDMAVRLVKLIFYQLIAPMPIYFRVIPEGKLSGTFNNWLKVTLTCYLEVYIRILVFYFCIYILNAIFSSNVFDVMIDGMFLKLFAKALVIMGIVMFMKQAPKIFSEVTGLDSGKMKLGIKDKLKDGGFFAAGAAVGAGATALTRNGINAIKNSANKFNAIKTATSPQAKRKATVAAVGSIFTGVGSAVAGGVSGVARGGKAGASAKGFGEMKGAAGKGAEEAVKARGKRANYKAAHGGFVGAVGGHIKDVGVSIRNYALDQSIEGLSRESQSMGKIASSFSTYSDGIESLLEKEQAKGDGSVFLGNGFSLTNYNAFDQAAKDVAKARADFNAGRLSADDLRAYEAAYVEARDNVRNELMNIGFKGQKGAEYQALNAKGQAALKDALVNAEALQATLLENASSSVVQNVVGPKGIEKIVNKDPSRPFELSDMETVDPVTGQTVKLKDAAKVAQGQADMKIAEMNKENAAKGESKK